MAGNVRFASEAEFAEFLEQSSTLDLTVRLGQLEWLVHGKLLVVRSEFFELALHGKFKESRTRIVELHEDCVISFCRLLEWIYTGDYNDDPWSVMPNGRVPQSYLQDILLLGMRNAKDNFDTTAMIQADAERSGFEVDTAVWCLADKYAVIDLVRFAASNLVSRFSSERLSWTEAGDRFIEIAESLPGPVVRHERFARGELASIAANRLVQNKICDAFDMANRSLDEESTKPESTEQEGLEDDIALARFNPFLLKMMRDDAAFGVLVARFLASHRNYLATHLRTSLQQIDQLLQDGLRDQLEHQRAIQDLQRQADARRYRSVAELAATRREVEENAVAHFTRENDLRQLVVEREHKIEGLEDDLADRDREISALRAELAAARTVDDDDDDDKTRSKKRKTRQ